MPLRYDSSQVPAATGVGSARPTRRASPVGADRRVFETLPHGYLILNTSLIIVDVNPAYARLTMTDPEQILGREIFAVFPDNPGDPEADGVANLSASLQQVLARKSPARMWWQRYDIRDRTGVFVERHWDPTNSPILDDNGEVEFIVHHVSDVTTVAKRLASFPRTQRPGARPAPCETPAAPAPRDQGRPRPTS